MRQRQLDSQADALRGENELSLSHAIGEDAEHDVTVEHSDVGERGGGSKREMSLGFRPQVLVVGLSVAVANRFQHLPG